MFQTPDATPDVPVLSVVVPFFNEDEVLDETYDHLKKHLDALKLSYEIIFVDDGSTDNSRGLVTAMSLLDPAIRVVALSRNFGHEMATTAGLRHARGQAAVVIDADLQDPPDLIANFVAKWREGYQVVYGVRSRRRGETVFKKLSAFVFYRLMSRLADVPFPADTGDFRLLDRRILDIYQQFDEAPRFFRGLVGWIGFKQIGIPFVRRPRVAGRTKYRYDRLVKLAFDTITAFSTTPALIITITAGIMAGLSALLIGGAFLAWVLGSLQLQGWMWAALGFLVLWNVQFVSVAVLGEYIVRTHRHTQNRPLYIVDCLIQGGKPI